MFRIGEFAQIAQVSQRQLRHYDQLGLLKPVRVDDETGYRYYSARQLPRLNRILALMDLGFTLQQIGPLIDGEIGADELRGMLTMKLAQVEQQLREDASRLRQIESRIAQIDASGAIADYDIVVKSAPATPFLSVRAQCVSMDEAFAMLRRVTEEGLRQVKPPLRQNLIVLARPDFQGDALDLEFGFSLARDSNSAVSLGGGLTMTASTLPAVENMATAVRAGPLDEAHRSLSALGVWMEANRYDIAGPCREVFLEPPHFGAVPEGVLEVQFPVRQAA